MQVEVARGGDQKCAARFDRWDSNRQRLFLYEKPLEVQGSDLVRISCVYTTQQRTVPVRAGEQIDDEQCLASLLVAGLGR
jgi:hypothetical protein